ncbi:MAG TPA: response regulator transcription factor [Actinomycetota bacterium]|nr:response regulator transcription factor [Actinomycetota bacterium]
MSEQRVLVVDDEPIVREVLGRYLEREGYQVGVAADGEEAIERFAQAPPDLVVLDLMMPRLDGAGVLDWIRRRAQTPVIMLTARGEETDRVVGLEMGADDYVTKPFSPREVTARIRAVLRRAARGDGDDGRLEHGDLSIDPWARRAGLRGEALTLTPKEFDLLHHFAANPGVVFSRIELLEDLWDFAFDGDPSTVTVHIRRLREKIEDDPSHPKRLVTVWGAGYRFDP